jgi:hypothetical protein
MIAAFVADTMSRYIAGGMKPETAARFTRGELSAIYKCDHRSRDTNGQWRATPPPEALAIAPAMAKCDEALAEILKIHAEAQNIYRGSAAIKHVLTAGIGIKYFFAKSGDNDPAAYSTDLRKIAGLWNEGQRWFKAFIRGRYLAVDIDRKPGKPDGLETFYRIFPRETLPAELHNLPQSFPCYVLTPSGGFHLYFRYDGPDVKLRELGPGVEIKECQITAPGSHKENGDYVLHGGLNEAPPLYSLNIDAIEEAKRKKEHAKAERSRPSTVKAAAKEKSGFEKMAEYAGSPA